MGKKKEAAAQIFTREVELGKREGGVVSMWDKGRVWRRVGGGEECDGTHGTGTYIQIYSRGEVCNHFNDGG